jgi:hypothetical protein
MAGLDPATQGPQAVNSEFGTPRSKKWRLRMLLGNQAIETNTSKPFQSRLAGSNPFL